MTRIRNRRLMMIVAAALLSAPAAVPVAYDPTVGLRLDAWMVGTVSAVLAAWCLMRSLARDGDVSWPRIVSALSLAALAPLATSGGYPMTGGVALIATSLAVAVASGKRGPWRIGVSGLLVAMACACDATSVVLPIGCAWHAITHAQGRREAVALLGAGMVGLAGSWLSGGLWPAEARTLLTVHENHRAVTLLLPVLVLGWAGYASGPRRRFRADVPAWLPSWSITATLGLAMGLVGMPVNVLVCVLPWWWLVPAGLEDLGKMVAGPRGGPLAIRSIGVLTCMVLAILAVPGVRNWGQGALLGWFMISEGR